MCWCMYVCVNKADGWGSVALQKKSPSWSLTAQEIQGYRWGQIPESEFCEVIGQIFLHGVTIMLHRLGRKALVGKNSHRK